MNRARQGLVVLAAALATLAGADSTMNTVNKWAWGKKTGWINCRPDSTNGAVIGQYACSGYFYSLATGYIHLGNGQPTNGLHYSNAATNDYGVNHDAQGNLRGYAWSDSIGWIAFESNGAPYVQLDTGTITGYAWSVTSGWIGFSNLAYFAQTDTFAPGPDDDGDGIPDAYEILTAKTTDVLTGTGDHDRDGVPDLLEYVAGTDPTDSNAYLRITGFDIEDNTNASIRWTSVPTRTYRIETAAGSTQTNWQDSPLGLILVGQPPESTRLLTGSITTQGSYRVKAVLPLTP